MPAATPANAQELSKEEEIESLKAQASELKQHLASLLERIDQLEEEE
jgi:ubiquinone biosynthesis protein UbiJ